MRSPSRSRGRGRISAPALDDDGALTIAYLGLGSNLGDRASFLSSAVLALDTGAVHVTKTSSVYETDPVGGPMQGDFLNQAVEVRTELDARALWMHCVAVEEALGRDRAREERWGPRTIDIDLLVFDDHVVVEDDLVVPHPRLSTRAFVLVPLAEIAPSLVIPRYGPLADLLEQVGPAPNVRRYQEQR